ncbi:MAG: acetolactate synthase [Phycisphaerae bacterium]
MEPKANQTARGHEEPFATQFSVFLANRIGQLRELLDLFTEENISVLGLSVIDSTDWAVIRVVLSLPNKAREVLRRSGLQFTESRVLLVEVPMQETLIDVCGLLMRAELSIHFAYSLAVHSHQNPVMVLHVDDYTLATHALIRRGYVLLGDEDLADKL